MESYLIELVGRCFVLGREKNEKLLSVPVEERLQIGLEVEHDVAEVLFFSWT